MNEAVFCLECGAELGVKCPNCEKSLPPRAKFCDTCGQELKQPQKPDPQTPEPTAVKGKSDPIRIYKVITQKEQPIKIHRLHGFQADLIGRTVEMSQLADAARKLKEGSGAVLSIFFRPYSFASVRIQRSHPFSVCVSTDHLFIHQSPGQRHCQSIPGDPPSGSICRLWKGKIYRVFLFWLETSALW